jgi:predicted nuclease of predicted toxin-antitoxin system
MPMLILLDENLLSRKLKQPFLDAGHQVNNVDDMGWRGYKDRQILDMATAHPFDVFITADKNLPFQQNLSIYAIRIVVLDVSNTKPGHLLPLMVQLSNELDTLFGNARAIMLNDTGEITLLTER